MQNSKDKIFLEDIAYGIYDRPGPMGRIADDEEEEITVPSDVPVAPSPQMSNQLSVDRPPIEDEDYVPTSIGELAKAAAAIAQLTPNDSVEYFYRQLHKLLDDATDKAAEVSMNDLEDSNQGLGGSPETSADDEVEKDTEESAVKESALRNVIRKRVLSAITEANWDSPDPRWVEDEGYSIEEPERDMSADGMGLDDLAAEFGYAGAPGVRQEIDRLTDRLKYFATKVKKQDLEALLSYSVGEYIDTLSETDLIDEEDVEDLRASPSIVRKLNSFKYFFVGSMVLPAYRQVVRTATKNVKKEIDDLGIPKLLHQTVFNQITGATSSKPEVIKKKLEKLVAAGDLSPEEAKKLAQKIKTAKRALLAASDYSDDLVQISLDKWQALGKSARIKAVKQAMEKTLEDK
jgi:hypothetical protein